MVVAVNKVLAGIVKNEESNVCKILENSKHFNHTVITDTGSTDKTVQLLESNGISVYHCGWKNFSYNRNQSFLNAIRKIYELNGFEYGPLTSSQLNVIQQSKWFIFTIDADDVYNWSSDFDYDSDVIRININANGEDFHRNVGFRWDPMDMKNLYWRYVLHEMCNSSAPWKFCDTISIKGSCTGFRSSNPDKYIDDAYTLTKILSTGRAMDHEIPRYKFYLARSVTTNGSFDQAVQLYLYIVDPETKIDLDHKYISYLACYYIYNNPKYINHDKDVAINYLRRAVSCFPQRPEAIRELFNYYHRELGDSFTAAAIGYAHIKKYDFDCKSGFLFLRKHGWQFLADLSYVLGKVRMNEEFCEVMDYLDTRVELPDENRARLRPNFTNRDLLRSRK